MKYEEGKSGKTENPWAVGNPAGFGVEPSSPYNTPSSQPYCPLNRYVISEEAPLDFPFYALRDVFMYISPPDSALFYTWRLV